MHFKARQAPLTSSVSLVRFILFNAENKDSKKHVDEKIVRKAGFFMSLKVSGNPSTQNVMRVTQNEFACHPGSPSRFSVLNLMSKSLSIYDLDYPSQTPLKKQRTDLIL